MRKFSKLGQLKRTLKQQITATRKAEEKAAMWQQRHEALAKKFSPAALRAREKEIWAASSRSTLQTIFGGLPPRVSTLLTQTLNPHTRPSPETTELVRQGTWALVEKLKQREGHTRTVGNADGKRKLLEALETRNERPSI